LITQGEQRETSAQNLKIENAARQIKGFCVWYVATVKRKGGLKHGSRGPWLGMDIF